MRERAHERVREYRYLVSAFFPFRAYCDCTFVRSFICAFFRLERKVRYREKVSRTMKAHANEEYLLLQTLMLLRVLVSYVSLYQKNLDADQ